MRPLLGLLFATMLVAAACGDTIFSDDRIEGSGTVVVETRSVDDYVRFDLRGEGIVVFGAGADGSIEIETDDNLLEYIETEVVDGELVIRTRPDTDVDPSDDIVYRLGCPSLSRVAMAGAGTVDAGACTASGEVAVAMAGAGVVRVPELAVDVVEVDLSGAGSIELAGEAAEASIRLSGAGSLEAEDLVTRTAVVTTTGAGGVTLTVTDSLDATVSGVGDIRYLGDPEVTATVTGIGAVEPAG